MAEITTTQAFSDGDTVTATKLNNITGNASLQTEAITNRSAETTVDQANDLLLMYDASATALKKVTLSNVIKAGTASNFPVTGNATIGGTLGVTGVLSAASTLELGHASDTTLARGAAGRLTVEGVNVPTISSTDTLTNKTLTSPSLTSPSITSGVLTTQAGTAGSPAISPTGDTNTGLFFPAADTIAFGEGGEERVRIDSSGNVGIGNSSPVYPLSVSNSASCQIQIRAGNTSDSALLFGDTDSAAIGRITYSHSGNDMSFVTNGAERLRIDSSGNVGIGTTSPARKLEVEASADICGQFVRTSTNTNAQQTILNIIAETSADMVDGFGTLVNSQIKDSAGVANNVGSIGFVRSGADNSGSFVVQTTNAGSSNERLRIDSSGNVGIGTTTINSKLEVQSVGVMARFKTGSAVDGRVEWAYNTTDVGYIGADSSTEFSVIARSGNALKLGAGGSERLRIDSSGNVIISSNKALISRGAGGVSNNSAVGEGALQANTTGYRNTANGYQALYSNTTGYQNTANGIQALYSNTTGHSNTANGDRALFSNTTGNYNTANGVSALYSNTTGIYNTANGVSALYSNTTGNYNTANGRNALYSNTTGDSNTAIGFQAGYGTGSNSNTTGSNNTFIGNEAVGTSSTASNTVVLGNGAITHLRCQVSTISSLSDRRDKKDIAPLAAGLDFVSRLRPVSFVWNTRDKAKVGIPDAGFIAQELLEVQEQTGITIPYLVSQDNPDKLEAGIGTLIPVLVQAIRELKTKVESLEEKLK